MKCTALKNKKSKNQCSSNAVFGKTLCGRHIRSKNIILWSDVHAGRVAKITRFQAIVRGSRLRSFLKLAGPGVLSRQNLANDEDVVTCNEKNKVHPLEYFSFEENGKIWWFEFSTIWTWCMRSLCPTNPYTKTPLDIDIKKRLRIVWRRRLLMHIPLPQEPVMFKERLEGRWNIICQIFREHGFEGVHPNLFIDMTNREYQNMFRMLYNDLDGNLTSGNLKWLQHVKDRMNKTQGARGILYASFTMMIVLITPRDDRVYSYVFHMLSALYRC
jgi:hypothetical protein